ADARDRGAPACGSLSAVCPASVRRPAARRLNPLALYLEGDSDGRIGREAHLVTFDLGDQRQVDEMIVALVAAFAAVGLGELDLAVRDAMDRPDMDAVGSDHFHVRLDVMLMMHGATPVVSTYDCA